MASAPRPSSRPRQTWRERSRPGATTAEAKLLKRWFWSLLFALLVAALAWLIWRYLFMPCTHFAYLAVTEYKKHETPPVPFFKNDAQSFETTVECQQLKNPGTIGSMDTVTANLDAMVPRSRDTLVFYVSAHGASFKSGANFEGYLLCEDFDSLKPARGQDFGSRLRLLASLRLSKDRGELPGGLEGRDSRRRAPFDRPAAGRDRQ